MKTFEELQHVIRGIVSMEEIFNSVVVIACHRKQIQRFTELKNHVIELLMKDVKQRPGSDLTRGIGDVGRGG